MIRTKGLALPLLTTALFCTACGPVGEIDKAPTKVYDQREQLQQYFASLAERGELDSGYEMLPEQIDKLRESNAELADKVQQGYQEIGSLRNPNAIKQKAQELADLLKE